MRDFGFNPARFGASSVTEREVSLIGDSEESFDCEDSSEVRFEEWSAPRTSTLPCQIWLFFSTVILYGGFSAMVAISFWFTLFYGFPTSCIGQKLKVLAMSEALQLLLAFFFFGHISFFQKQLLCHGFLAARQKLGFLKTLPFMLMGGFGTCYLINRAFFSDVVEVGNVILLVVHHFGHSVVAFCALLAIPHGPCLLNAKPDVTEKLKQSMGSDISQVEGSNSIDILQCQSVIIEFQDEQIHSLSSEVRRNRERNGSSSRLEGLIQDHREAVDLLRQREQEYEALQVEKMKLQNDLEQTVDEKSKVDEELQRLHASSEHFKEEISKLKDTNSKFAEENNRLRFMLDEWSARSLKLEIAMDKQLLTIEELESKIAAMTKS